MVENLKIPGTQPNYIITDFCLVTGFFKNHIDYKIIKVLTIVNVMSVSQLLPIVQMHALTSMNVLKIQTTVAIMPTAVTMMEVSHANVTMASKLVHLILIPVQT